ncbi:MULTISPECIES: RDD family protein [Rubrivivax]|uniref:RDD family protein n=1 Tax=Rubrivivax benzoatilyticus TaxID=316997 RepID=A0ABX0HUC9_9BURK|nr:MULTISPECIES: RDD family protein [Rubrivivax]MCD0421470.1 RDD family protein [Rubrivivax sp. JA1024]EGJ12482.1 RDD domain-containing protein [Rubrivivax benzoatilyticus JA2 = ATCC BAA-35]MCC9597664.1 RDD family protein [Rubrivivax sp. JA1055]MCC9646078.1 RDD family protein [Rubrivivax sp. JA1029]NHK98223.1 RDD family protein [Rubrivivax benzoatilyticus]
MIVLPPAAGDHPTPALIRRLACFVYEGILLFGVVMAAGLVYSLATNQRSALQGQLGLQVFLFLVFGLYFVWFWSRTGQTLAMQTWHIRLVQRDGQPVSVGRGIVRYLVCWVWFLPWLAIAHFAGLHSNGQVFGLLTLGIVVWAALSRLHPDRQFWHDALCGTRLVAWRAKSKD